jgi:diguanylate cyclase (GGDEF)-like protein
MNYAFLPDLSALAILIVILYLLYRRHPHEQAGTWLAGLLFTLIEAIAHIFYAPTGVPAALLHVIVLDCYLIAGLIFIWASGGPHLTRKGRLLYLSLSGLPLLLLNTTYGLNIRMTKAYFPAIAIGIIVGTLSTIYLRRNWFLTIANFSGWLIIAILVHDGDFRNAVYWSLCCVYAIAAINFQHRLPRESTGRIAIVTGFFIWALCFLVHPLIMAKHAAYAEIASHVWNMQKSLISIGMILVMLEEQVSNNAWLALHDELTGLPNRRLFADRLTHAMGRCRRTNDKLALLVLDLNGFKSINDSLGHHVGDQVLREFASKLRCAIRSTDTLARLGGDEFIIVATDFTTDFDVEHLADSLLCEIEKPLQIDGQSMPVTASLGIAIYPDDAEDSIKLLRIADQRMYDIKHKLALTTQANPYSEASILQ